MDDAAMAQMTQRSSAVPIPSALPEDSMVRYETGPDSQREVYYVLMIGEGVQKTTYR
jgi:hypothetical protein